MRQTNKAKYDLALAALDREGNALIEQFFADRPRPEVVYLENGKMGLQTATVTEIYYRTGFWPQEKPTNKLLDKIASRREPLIFDKSNLWVRLTMTGSMNWTLAKSWEELEKKTTAFLDREEAEEHHRQWLEKYGDREGFKPCAYCGRQVEEGKLIEKRIIVYPAQTVYRKFCSGQCAAYEQMAQEG